MDRSPEVLAAARPGERLLAAARTPAARPATLAALLLLSGSATLANEVLWTRELGAIVGNTAHASAVLTVFFAGMAAGTAFLGRRRWWIRDPLLAYAALEARSPARLP